ncbi:MAG: Smr/MutS family protein, partial [Candidatus Ornithospirochaeta sp.]
VLNHPDGMSLPKGDKGLSKARTYTQNELRSMNPQATLDLHGENKTDSAEEVKSFLSSSRESGLRKISIITGKGLHSQDGQGVLRSVVEETIKEFDFISEVSNAPLNKGGSGALWLILKEKDK